MNVEELLKQMNLNDEMTNTELILALAKGVQLLESNPVSDLPEYTYLYGFTKEQIKQLESMPYKEALTHKVKSAHQLAARLLSIPFMEQDSSRITQVLKAEKFNIKLINELKD